MIAKESYRISPRELHLLQHHRCHDYQYIIGRWKSLAEKLELQKIVLAKENDLPIYVFTNEVKQAKKFYISTGIHGDQPAAVTALLEWAENNKSFIRKYFVTIIPCFNPWGLIHNTRFTFNGKDLRANFHDTKIPLVKAWQDYLKGTYYDLSLCLREDFIAQGNFMLELNRGKEQLGKTVLEKCQPIIPIDSSNKIGFSKVKKGLIRRTRYIKEYIDKVNGYPEPVYLYLSHAKASLTFHTPSQFSLYHRIKSHRECLRTLAAQFRSSP